MELLIKEAPRKTNHEDFYTNIIDYIRYQLAYNFPVSGPEEFIQFLFGTTSRDKIVFSCQQMLIGDVDEEIDEAMGSNLPAILVQQLGRLV